MPKVTWNQDEVEDRAPTFDLLPRGKYPTIINSIEEVKTKDKKGSFYECILQVVKGDFKGRKLWARLNVNNPSEVAQNIGRAQFKQLCEAAGKPGAKTTEVLHGKYVVALVSIERQQGYDDKNRVDGFESPEKWKAAGGEDAMPTAADAPAPEPAAGKGKLGGKKKVDDFDDDIPF